MRKFNPIKGTTKHFIPAGARRRGRHKSPKDSNWVRFMNSLENRGPLSPGSPYERWTKKVRADMELANTWPKGEDTCSVHFVAEYWSRLLREFWNDNPKVKWYEFRGYKHKRTWSWPTGSRTLCGIYKKIKDKGRRDRLFVTEDWCSSILIGYAFVCEYEHKRGRIEIFTIEPYRDFNDHGAEI